MPTKSTRRARSQARKPVLSDSPNAIRLRRLRARAVKNGKCRVCRARYPKAGLKICEHCHALKSERAASYVSWGLCACGNRPAKGKLRCGACTASNAKSRAKRVSRFIAIGKCCQCGVHWPIAPKKTCEGCISEINAYGALRAAVNRATGLCACGRERAPGFLQCKRCHDRPVRAPR